MADLSAICIRGARTHNLRDIDVDLPRHRLIVVTGVSGSGKSSLAFDTLFAEGQRRYVESLSPYARQFLDRLPRPDVDRIEGLAPAIAIDQRPAAPNPRSTIATLTEIHDYLRVLYAALGQPHDPETGEPLRRLTTPEMVDRLAALPEGTRLVLLAPVEAEDGRFDLASLRDRLKRQGFVRWRVDGEVRDLDEPLPSTRPESVEIVIDRLVVRAGVDSRLTDSLETARRWARHRLLVVVRLPKGDEEKVETLPVSFTNPETGFTLPEPEPRHFSFNSPAGACPDCHGLGTVPGPDPDRLVPDPGLSLNDGAVKCWWPKSRLKSIAVWRRGIDALARHYKVSGDVPFCDLPEAFREALWHGTGGEEVATGWTTGPERRPMTKPFPGLLEELSNLLRTARSETLRRHLARFVSHCPCPTCRGRRLLPWVLAVTLDNGREPLPIDGFCDLSVEAALAWMEDIEGTGARAGLAAPLIGEVRQRLEFLSRVGLDYLSLSRVASTLSGGEFQRIRLATQVGGALSGVLYVLDEPSIGLHPRDHGRLLEALHHLRDLGNTVLVVEHDLDTLRAADYLIDIGPGAGRAGGELLYAGSPRDLVDGGGPSTLTGDYLAGRKKVTRSSPRRSPGRTDLADGRAEAGWLGLLGARGHNLRAVDLKIPLGCLTVVAGVSGSGKSSLIEDTLRPALARQLHGSTATPLPYDALVGTELMDKVVAIDQGVPSRSARSNPATYSGAFDIIRRLFAATPAARARGFDASRFSFNRPGGRCEACGGDGTMRIEMQFLADLTAPCESCGGTRYNRETLEVTYKGRSIAEILEMTVEEATDFFGRISDVARKLESLCRAGLGYLCLGQPVDTLSGGESQRLKLASELARKPGAHTLYLLDEPTTGLHLADVQLLLDNLLALRDQGHTVVVVEHHPDMLRHADWMVEMGPGGGPHGGCIIATGPPEDVAKVEGSPTAPWLV